MDMRKKVTELKSKLKELLEKESVTEGQRDLIATAMEFGYASAYCARTCDMNESFFAGMQYDDEYTQMVQEVKK